VLELKPDSNRAAGPYSVEFHCKTCEPALKL
jgi:hypothetical protein